MSPNSISISHLLLVLSYCLLYEWFTTNTYFQFCASFVNNTTLIFLEINLIFRNSVTFEFNTKVKWSRYRSDVAQRVGRDIALLFHDRGTRRGWVFSSTPRPHFTPGKNRYPFYRRLGGPQGRSELAENLFPTGIRSRTLQLVALSLYRMSYRAHPV